MLKHPLIEIRLNTPYHSSIGQYDRIFWTGSIDEFFNYEYGQLPYRSVSFELEEYDKEFYQNNAVINYPCNYDFTRIHEYKHYLQKTTKKTVIAKEYSHNFELGKNDRYYPIPDTSATELYNRYLCKAKNLCNTKNQENIYFLGRLGDYKYYNMDEAIKRALDLFEEIKNAK